MTPGAALSTLHADELDEYAVALLEECGVAAMLGEVDESLRARTRTSARLVAGLLAADAPVLAAAARRAEVALASDGPVTPDHGAALAHVAHGARALLLGAQQEAYTAVVDVVVVSEEGDARTGIASALRRCGLEVVELHDGRTALDRLTGDLRARVVVVDADLPGLDGLALLRRLRTAGALSGMRALMVSARRAEAEVMEAFALGADDHVALPCSLPVLVHRVRRLLAA